MVGLPTRPSCPQEISHESQTQTGTLHIVRLWKRLIAIILAFIAERYVFIHFDTHASYIVTGAICLEQALSILENWVSCPLDDGHDNRFWRTLRRILIDKTERHFDITLDEYKDNDEL